MSIYESPFRIPPEPKDPPKPVTFYEACREWEEEMCRELALQMASKIREGARLAAIILGVLAFILACVWWISERVELEDSCHKAGGVVVRYECVKPVKLP